MIDIRPLPGPQTRALSISGIREILYGGARGGGKTFTGILWIMRPAVEDGGNKKYRGLVIRRNFTDACDWIDRAMQLYSGFGAKMSGTDIKWPCGAIIRVGHLADASAYEKYQGHEYHRMLIEELTQIPQEESYLKLASSCRSVVPELKPSIFATANPGGSGHSWVKARFVKPAQPGKAFRDENGLTRIFIPAKLEDNPYLNKDETYRKSLESLPTQLRRAWLDGDWDTLSGQFFSEWDDSIHVCEPFAPPQHWKRYAALDWGYRPDPWVCLWVAVDEFGTGYLYREADGNEDTPQECAKILLELSEDDPKIVSRVADPSMWAKKDGLSSAEKMGQGGWWITQANNDRENGAMRIREYLRINPGTGKPWLQIMRHCRKTIQAMKEVLHDEKEPLKIGPHPLDHWTDALRYHLMDRPSRSFPAAIIPPENSLELMELRNKQ